MTLEWRPTATISTLKKRAQLLADIRAFFSARNLLEVDVPALSLSTVTDPHLQSIPAQVGSQQQFLQTSPEFYMKRLLAAGLGSCFYLGKAFRQDEQGRRHRPEFTLLEWYRVGFDDLQLRREVLELIAALAGDVSHRQVSYRDLFVEYLSIDPHSATADELALLAKSRLDFHWPDQGADAIGNTLGNTPLGSAMDKSSWLDLLFSHCIEPRLDSSCLDTIVLVYDYPACQCALAKIERNERGQTVAKRFELFWNGMELANGYWELTDKHEQAARFENDSQTRRQLGLPAVEPDARLLEALATGLPECAGVALGVDRLLMCLLDVGSIDEVVPF